METDRGSSRAAVPGYCYGLPFLLETPDVASAIALCVRENLRFVELNSNFPQCRLDILKGMPLRVMAKQHGLFFTLHLDDRFDPFDFNLLVREAYTQTMLNAIGLAKEAGMPIINMHIPRGNIVTLPEGKHYLYQEYHAEYIQAVLLFRERCQAAIAGSGVRIAIENSDSWEPYERAAIELLLEGPVFGLCLDIGHDHAAGNRDLPFIIGHQDRLIHMHAHDGWGQTNHQALGTGEIPLKQRLAMAEKAGATVVLETKTIAALNQSVRYLLERGML
jgi:sugar phosphate isomerase/epimerase